jgi:hypothetical protein
LREIEREAAKILYEEFGIEKLKARYADIQRLRERRDPLCPQIYKPSDFLQKMKNMEEYIKNGRN